jgi:hypothetical protein
VKAGRDQIWMEKSFWGLGLVVGEGVEELMIEEEEEGVVGTEVGLLVDTDDVDWLLVA